MKYFYIALIALSLLVSCGKKEEAAKDPHTGMNMQDMSKGQAVVESAKTDMKIEGSTMTFANVKMTVPALWIKEEPASPVRFVQFTSKDDEEFVVAGFYFGKQDEMVDANIKRWEAEFSKLDKNTRKEFAGGKVVMVTLEGTYKKKPFPMAEEFTETPNYTTIAAIVKTSDGPYFFKAVSSNSAIKNEMPNFESFLSSYSAK